MTDEERTTIELRMPEPDVRKWLERVEHAMSDHGSNDAEHDLLYEIADEIGIALGVTFTAGAKLDEQE